MDPATPRRSLTTGLLLRRDVSWMTRSPRSADPQPDGLSQQGVELDLLVRHRRARRRLPDLGRLVQERLRLVRLARGDGNARKAFQAGREQGRLAVPAAGLMHLLVPVGRFRNHAVPPVAPRDSRKGMPAPERSPEPDEAAFCLFEQRAGAGRVATDLCHLCPPQAREDDACGVTDFLRRGSGAVVRGGGRLPLTKRQQCSTEVGQRPLDGVEHSC